MALHQLFFDFLQVGYFSILITDSNTIMNAKIALVFFFCIFAMIMAKPWIQGPGKLIYLYNTPNCKGSKELNKPPPR